MAVYHFLDGKSFDVFVDTQSLGHGDFAPSILENIESRAHFLLVLTSAALDRIDEPDDWLRREVGHAVQHRRNVVPMMFEGFDEGLLKRLPASIAALGQYNALKVPKGYFTEAMTRLVNRYLATAPEPPSVEPSREARQAATRQRALTIRAAQKVSPLDRQSRRASLEFRFERSGDVVFVMATYRSQLAESPHWSSRVEFLRVEELEHYATRNEALQARSARRSHDLAREFGELGSELFALLTGPLPVGAFLYDQRALRISLRFRDSLLDRLPWEYLKDRSGASIGMTPGGSISRTSDFLSSRITGLAWPIEVLGVVSDPGMEWERLDSDRERHSLDRAIDVSGGGVNLKWARDSTLDSLIEHLYANEFHVLHFVGHTGRDERGSYLVFEGGRGDSRCVYSSDLAVLAHMRSLRVVVLSSFDSDVARAVARDFQEALGLPAVVVLPFAVGEEETRTFVHAFYVALGRMQPLDVAVQEGRLALARRCGHQWGLPTLFAATDYFRSAD